MAPELAEGVCQRTGEALGKSAMKGRGEKWLWFFPQLFCTHCFSRRLFQEGLLMLVKQKVPVSLDNSLLEGEEKVPKSFMPKNASIQ